MAVEAAIAQVKAALDSAGLAYREKTGELRREPVLVVSASSDNQLRRSVATMWSEVGVDINVVGVSDTDWTELRAKVDRVKSVIRPIAKLNSVGVDWADEANMRMGIVRFIVRNIVADF